MKIETIKLRNFKSFKEAEMTDVPSFCVVVGANGTGKSTLFDVFGFLKDCLTYNVRRALESRGGFKEVISRGAKPDENIDIDFQFRLKIAGVNRLVTYSLRIGLDQKKRPVVKREILQYKRGQYGSPFHFIRFTEGEGYAVTNEEDFDKKDEELEREWQSVEPDVLAIKGLGQFKRFAAASAFRELIENWHVSDFHINLARGSKDGAGYAEHLSETGDNLQLVAKHIRDTAPDRFAKIIAAMRRRIPGVVDVTIEDLADGRLLLRFQDGSFKDPFIDKYVSDGTIKMFAYLVLLYDPQPHPLLCVEEPENQLYHRLQPKLAEEFRLYTNHGGQVFVSTHSPDFLNGVELDEAFWLVKEKGCTKIMRAKDDVQISAYMNDSDKLGYLWKQGFFTGADPA